MLQENYYQGRPIEKTIVLLGKTGAGKCTLASHIFGKDDEFPIHRSVESATRTPELIVHNEVHSLDDELVRVIIMDIGGLHGTNYNMWRVLQEIEAFGHVSAIFFLLKYGRVTQEDSYPINVLISGLQNHSIICYLIITGCEGKDHSVRNDIINIYISDMITHGVCSFVGRQKIVPVGFPNINEITNLAIRSQYEEGMLQDDKVIRRIVKSAQQTRISVLVPWYRRAWSTVQEQCTIL